MISNLVTLSSYYKIQRWFSFFLFSLEWSTQSYTFIIDTSQKIEIWWQAKTQSNRRPSQMSRIMFLLIVKTAGRRRPFGKHRLIHMQLATESEAKVVYKEPPFVIYDYILWLFSLQEHRWRIISYGKILQLYEYLGYLRCNVQACRKNLKRREILRLPDSWHKWEPRLKNLILMLYVTVYVQEFYCFAIISSDFYPYLKLCYFTSCDIHFCIEWDPNINCNMLLFPIWRHFWSRRATVIIQFQNFWRIITF